MAVVICTCRACNQRFAPPQATLDWTLLAVPIPLVFGGILGAWSEQQPALLVIALLGLALLPLVRRMRATPCPSCGSSDTARRVVAYLTLCAEGAYQRR